MNSGVISKVEYKLSGESSFTDLDIIPYSGKFSDNGEQTNAGMRYSFSGSFKKEEVSIANDAVFESIVWRKATFRVTDAGGTKHLVGDNSYPARLTYSRDIDGTPGSFNGYRCTIRRDAPYPATIDS